MSFFKTLIEGPIPRGQLVVLTPLAALFLISFFLYLGFPYDQLAMQLSNRIAEGSGNDVRIEGISPRITIGGPGFSADEVLVITADADRYLLGPVSVRPAWSSSWLRGQPALHLDVESGYGNLNGMVIVGDLPGFDGTLSAVDIESIPIPAGLPVSLRGKLGGVADLQMGDAGLVGRVDFLAESGSILHDALPLAIDYDRVEGSLDFGGEHWIEVKVFELNGPLLTASAEGHVGHGPNAASRQVDLGLDLRIMKPNLAMLVQGFGVPLDGDGRASFDVGGNLLSPRIQ